jgi:predicted RNA-binding protein with PIN domain
VARRGLTEDPPVVPPARLRPFLTFTRLSPAVLQAVARVVDSDEGFRARVAGAVDEDVVGRAGWLWLQRPDGYLDDLDALEQDAESAAAAQADDREERTARKRLAAARAAADRASAMARAHAQEVDELRAELAGERARLAEVHDQATELSDELERTRSERTRAVRELKDVETRLVARSAEIKQAKEQVRSLKDELGRDGQAPSPLVDPVHPTDSAAVAVESTPVEPAATAGSPLDDTLVASPPTPLESAPVPPPVDLAVLGEALRSAARGAAELARALGDIEAAVGAAGEPGRAHPGPGSGGADADLVGTGSARGNKTPPGAGGPRHRRVPSALPGGVLDDSVEAVEHLLRSPGVLLLVDGYNVTMTGWPELAVGEQRRRLLATLGEAAARTGAAVEVVFDGADVEMHGVSRQVRQLVRVRFSPPDIEADDVLLELLSQLPTSRPVVVVSSDRRVRDGARRQGANLVHARQLVGLLRR